MLPSYDDNWNSITKYWTLPLLYCALLSITLPINFRGRCCQESHWKLKVVSSIAPQLSSCNCSEARRCCSDASDSVWRRNSAKIKIMTPSKRQTASSLHQHATQSRILSCALLIFIFLFRKTTLQFVSGFYTFIRCHELSFVVLLFCL